VPDTHTISQITLHYILSFSHEEYSRRTSLSKLIPHYPPYKTETPPETVPDLAPHPARKANAAFVILARNGDLSGVLNSMKQMEDRFNKKFGYPYVFLNEEPFTDEFKK
jgi:alpha 1,2-mannosyltransferase